MAYLCVTCVPFNSQHKCFSALDSTAWVSLTKARQRLSALLITQPKRCRSPACLRAKQGLPEPGTTQLPLVWSSWSADKFHPDSKHSAASSVSQYFSLPKDPQCHAWFNGTSPQWALCSCRLGQCGCVLPLRGHCVTRHLKGPENGTCHTPMTASPV